MAEFLKKVAIAIAALTTIAACAGMFMWSISAVLAPRSTTDELPNWQKFSREVDKEDFSIPLEAKILRAQSWIQGMSGGYEVEFELPTTKSPQDWILQVAAQCNAENCRVSEFAYDCDTHDVSYLPDEEVYRIRAFWD